VSGISSSIRYANILVAMMNEIFPFLNFTIELGEDFSDGKLPSLDTKIWVMDGWRVLFQFFEKTMTTNLMVEAESALSREIKLSTLSEEVTRRLRNTSLDLDSTCRMEILERVCVKMKTSGHIEQFIRQAVEQGISSFDEKVKRSRLEISHHGFQPLFPKAGWRKDKEKSMKRGTWFRGDQKVGDWKSLSKTDRKVRKKGFKNAGKVGKPRGAATTVVFVPSNKGSVLLKSLKDEEDKMAEMTGFRIKYQQEIQPKGRHIYW
jgi:hypothetical protein